MVSRRIVKVGSRFNRLTVLALAGLPDHPQSLLLCGCDCGTSKIMKARDVVHGRAKSCGCLQRESAQRVVRDVHEKNRKHGLCDSDTYNSWQSMIERCRNERNDRFASYGGRGITVCVRWMDFRNFLSDMGERPKGRTLDRKDNDGNYEPDNCRWATPKQQQRNARRTTFVDYHGKRRVFRDLCEQLGIDHSTVAARIRRGWPIQKALETKPLWHRQVKQKEPKP